jgi:hypothetical protein
MELKAADCAAVNKVFQNEAGIESADLTELATAVHTQRIQFKPSDRSATVVFVKQSLTYDARR